MTGGKGSMARQKRPNVLIKRERSEKTPGEGKKTSVKVMNAEKSSQEWQEKHSCANRIRKFATQKESQKG